ncbi:MAG TPA: hypothetical protein VFG65_06565 [Fimbriimonadales bacterium]|jgi:hypothetical protein|nr:hypothetical protein [Fimbriimonadales bacterium]
MSCNQDEYAKGHLPFEYAPSDPASASNTVSPYLILSNSPEKITSAMLPGTLYKCVIPVSTTQQRIRLYLWHLNDSGGDVHVSVVVSVDSGSATISNVKRQATPPPNSGIFEQGICLAEAQLYGALDPDGTGTTIGTNETILRSYTVAAGKVLGVVLEFDIAASAICSLKFRTGVGTGTGVPGSWGDEVLPRDVVPFHPRGWWPYSAIDVVCGTFDITPNEGSTYHQTLCCKKDGVEQAKFAKQLSDEFGSDNRGEYGVDLSYTVVITCQNASSGTLFAYILALHTNVTPTPTPYFGAASISAWVDRPDRGVPPISWSNPDGSDQNLNIINLTQDGALTVTQSEPKTLIIRLSNGGAATMPFMLFLSKISLNIQP